MEQPDQFTPCAAGLLNHHIFTSTNASDGVGVVSIVVVLGDCDIAILSGHSIPIFACQSAVIGHTVHRNSIGELQAGLANGQSAKLHRINGFLVLHGDKGPSSRLFGIIRDIVSIYPGTP